MSPLSVRSVVLTGAPAAGKTVIALCLASEFPERFAVVPEAATQVYQALHTRWSKLDKAGRCDVQRRIYRLQVEQEAHCREADPGKTLIVDRGTLDGAAYWPGGSDDYWRDLGTSCQIELARYDMVVWLQSTAAIRLYDGRASNFCRSENPDEAVRIGERLKEIWQVHPRLHCIMAAPSIEEKYAAVLRLLAPT